ncbi:MAG TPA: chorismate mutase [Candidatus Acidoferrales bacterium]|nr:chorismate mutase [Candidatus Acidoferrales bacterium]
MDINDWRKRIDELDEELVELLNERSRCAAEVGRLKRQGQRPLHQPEREQEILERVQRVNKGPLGNEALKRLFERILEETRMVQQQVQGDEEPSDS